MQHPNETMAENACQQQAGAWSRTEARKLPRPSWLSLAVAPARLAGPPCDCSMEKQQRSSSGTDRSNS